MSVSTLASLPDTLRILLEKLGGTQLSANARVLLSGAAVLIVLKLLLGKSKAKKGKYIRNLDKVGQRTGDNVKATGNGVDAEYDIIIVGGGE